MAAKMAAKARDLFALCDAQGRGFATRADLQRLRHQLDGVDADQLQLVFDSLDTDGNGYLTLEEFTEAFGSFVAADQVHADEDAQYEQLLHQLDCDQVFIQEETARALWRHLRRRDDVEATLHLERLLVDVSRRHQQLRDDVDRLVVSHNRLRQQQWRRTDEEIDEDPPGKATAILPQKRNNDPDRQQPAATESDAERRHVQQLQQRLEAQSRQLEQLERSRCSDRRQLGRAQAERQRLQVQLHLQQAKFVDLKSATAKLRHERSDRQRRTADDALHLAESVAIERQGLLRQLHALRNINTRLQDQADELLCRPAPPSTTQPVSGHKDGVDLGRELEWALQSAVEPSAPQQVVAGPRFRAEFHRSPDVVRQFRPDGLVLSSLTRLEPQQPTNNDQYNVP